MCELTTYEAQHERDKRDEDRLKEARLEKALRICDLLDQTILAIKRAQEGPDYPDQGWEAKLKPTVNKAIHLLRAAVEEAKLAPL